MHVTGALHNIINKYVEVLGKVTKYNKIQKKLLVNSHTICTIESTTMTNRITTIHDLPKDMLIKLVTTIEQDTEKRLSPEILISKLWKDDTYTVNCVEKNCEELMVTSANSKIFKHTNALFPLVSVSCSEKHGLALYTITVPTSSQIVDLGLYCNAHKLYACKNHFNKYFVSRLDEWCCQACSVFPLMR
jgi:hypothetical protein